MSLVTASQCESIGTYLALMEEARARIEVINQAYHNHERLAPRFVRESCYLQLRQLWEIVGLGCLVIHDGVTKTRRLMSAYEPMKMLAAMGALKPHFYPQPICVTREGPIHTFAAAQGAPHLSRAELRKLWTRSGDFLHRGSLSKLERPEAIVAALKPIDSSPTAFPDVFEWSAKVVGLLNNHWITLADNKRGIVVSLFSENGQAKASLFDFNTANRAVISVSVESFEFQKASWLKG
ncbi:MAG: hypothetical protein U1F54_18125 [Burkholderiales bacterium]